MRKSPAIKPAKLEEVITELFENQKFTSNGYAYEQYFSKVFLNPTQFSQLTYTQGFIPLNYYIIYQTDQYLNCQLVSTRFDLVSFVVKNDRSNYLYGYYFDVSGQTRFDPKYLTCSPCPALLSPTTTFISSNYIEVYNKIYDNVVILSLGFSSNPNDSFATIQFSKNDRYIYQQLNSSGLNYVNDPDPLLYGLSCNLQSKSCSKCCKCCM